jgi:hypothetical protein
MHTKKLPHAVRKDWSFVQSDVILCRSGERKLSPLLPFFSLSKLQFESCFCVGPLPHSEIIAIGSNAMCRIRVASLVSIFFVASLFACFSCKETPPEPPSTPPTHVPVMHLSVADTGLTELWLRVRFDDTVQQCSWRLTRDGQPLLTLAQAPLDTVVHDDSLAVKRTYTYKAYRVSGSLLTDSTALLQATTLDTTSHNFFWQIDTLGDGNSSVLYDVAIINDTLTIACGELYLRDSTGQYQPPYGLAIWNGRQWQLKRLYATGPTGVVSILVPRGIWALSTTEIWFASGGVFRWNGRDANATPYWINSFPGNPNPIWSAGQYAQSVWGSGSQRIYAIGTAGAIAEFDGTAWQRLESGTTLPMNDIWGARNLVTGETEILTVASNTAIDQGVKLLQIKSNAVTEVSSLGLPWKMSGVWFQAGVWYFAVGDGLFQKRSLASPEPWEDLSPGLTQYYMRAIRGSKTNNIVVVGDFGSVLHFSGCTWRSLQSQTQIEGIYMSVDLEKKFVVAVGFAGARAVALRGYQQ